MGLRRAVAALWHGIKLLPRHKPGHVAGEVPAVVVIGIEDPHEYLPTGRRSSLSSSAGLRN
jgi:hypothetical protein